MPRREYSGAAPTAHLSAGFGSTGATSFAVDSGTGFPTGVVGTFFVVVDPGTSSEEKILCSARSGATFTISARGQDGTAAVAHSSGATVQHVFTATDADDANDHIYTTTRDDHTQYYNAARHTKAVHDALSIDAGTVGGFAASGLARLNAVWNAVVTGSSKLWKFGAVGTGKYLAIGIDSNGTPTLTAGNDGSADAGIVFHAQGVGVSALDHPLEFHRRNAGEIGVRDFPSGSSGGATDTGAWRVLYDSDGSTVLFRQDGNGRITTYPAPSFQTPTYTNSWVDFGGATQAGRFWKDPFGVVHIEGDIKSGTIDASAFTLPSGYRPAANQLFPVASNGAFGYVTVTSAGLVVVQAPSSNTLVSLSGITFAAA